MKPASDGRYTMIDTPPNFHRARSAYGPQWLEGDVAQVTTRSGVQYRAVYTLARGIGYFWAALDTTARPMPCATPTLLQPASTPIATSAT